MAGSVQWQGIDVHSNNGYPLILLIYKCISDNTLYAPVHMQKNVVNVGHCNVELRCQESLKRLFV